MKITDWYFNNTDKLTDKCRNYALIFLRKYKYRLCKYLFITILACLFGQNLSFSVYWNVPTEECHKYGINFNFSEYNIIANSGDKFYGDKILDEFSCYKGNVF
ncbi:hypothetical protein Avbf_18801 [Armadillidium vulgare]|nr:hypothetical protein Avbf_18801 [Armadillidium vulgare]